MRGRAFAKLNLGLRVASARADGFHPIESLAQSIDWSDRLEAEPSESDSFAVRGADLPDDESNLAWRGLIALRTGARPSISAELEKDIPVAAGLGGGSADAALGLALGAELLGRSEADATDAASSLGADVQFCWTGGRAVVAGIGDVVTPSSFDEDFAVAVVVPPFELSTPRVYRRWDELGEPSGPGVDARHLPVSLREHAPLVNDLTPAALDLAPDLGDWIADIASAWSQPVLMTGSGPALYSLFGGLDEATDAVGAVRGARAVKAVLPAKSAGG